MFENLSAELKKKFNVPHLKYLCDHHDDKEEDDYNHSHNIGYEEEKFSEHQPNILMSEIYK